jgi:hypothetical protein
LDRPNKITNRNSGSQEVIVPLERKRRIGSAQRCWKTSTSTPYAAATESRFSATAVSGTITDRNATISRPKASTSTNATAYGRPSRIRLVKSTS